MIKRLVFGFFTIGFFAIAANGQTSNVCIINQPIPELPKYHGSLDAQTSVMFRAEFLSDGTLGKTALVKSSHIQQLDDLASEAVRKVRFKPKKIKGTSITTYEILTYRYSWRFPGWRVERLKSLQLCPKEKKLKAKG